MWSASLAEAPVMWMLCCWMLEYVLHLGSRVQLMPLPQGLSSACATNPSCRGLLWCLGPSNNQPLPFVTTKQPEAASLPEEERVPEWNGSTARWKMFLWWALHSEKWAGAFWRLRAAVLVQFSPGGLKYSFRWLAPTWLPALFLDYCRDTCTGVPEITSTSFSESRKYANLNSSWLTNARGVLGLNNEDLCCKNRLEYLLASACWK